MSISGKAYYAHKVVYSLYNRIDLDAQCVVDHIDRNTTNNSTENLRLTTVQGNNLNASLRKDNSCGIQGIRKLCAKGWFYWVARWKENGKLIEKCFSVSVLGEDKAKQSAIDFRNQKITEQRKLIFKE